MKLVFSLMWLSLVLCRACYACHPKSSPLVTQHSKVSKILPLRPAHHGRLPFEALCQVLAGHVDFKIPAFSKIPSNHLFTTFSLFQLLVAAFKFLLSMNLGDLFIKQMQVKEETLSLSGHFSIMGQIVSFPPHPSKIHLLKS